MCPPLRVTCTQHDMSKTHTTPCSTRIQTIQAEMTDRAIELLALDPEDEAKYLLDIGCGSGLSGEILDQDGHYWVGVDVSPSMLEVAVERQVEGDLFLQDIGQGFGFRPGTFDGAISISVLQWLLNADDATHSPAQRITRFFTTLHGCLRNPSRAVFQFYPSSDDQVHMLTTCAQRAGFGGGVVVDYPNSTKKRKMYLCLMVGHQQVPAGLTEGSGGEQAVVSDKVKNEARRKQQKLARKRAKGELPVGTVDKAWILKKKDLYRQRKGTEQVPRDSKVRRLFLTSVCLYMD